jgi:small-conductance mechanosensitive channel
VSSRESFNKHPSFTSQEIDLSDYFFTIEGYEGFFYTLYLITIPYITGAVFLFFYVAKGDFSNFMLLDINAFFVVWLIGYEIVATFILIAILISFLRYDKKTKNHKQNRHH